MSLFKLGSFLGFIRILLISFALVLGLVGCGDNSLSSDEIQTVQMKVSGLSEPVTVHESVNNVDYQFTRDGNFSLNIRRGIYRFEVKASGAQSCSINHQLELSCEEMACTADYMPVCAKEPFVIQCVTTPCTTDRYKTYSNLCQASADNAAITFNGECGVLEDVIALHYLPAKIVPLASTSIYTDEYQMIESEVDGDVLRVITRVQGGCGTHQVNLYADNIITNPETTPPTIGIAIAHQNFDSCNQEIDVTTYFDLLPVKETYRRLFPEFRGTVTIKLGELGNYNFDL